MTKQATGTPAVCITVILQQHLPDAAQHVIEKGRREWRGGGVVDDKVRENCIAILVLPSAFAIYRASASATMAAFFFSPSGGMVRIVAAYSAICRNPEFDAGPFPHREALQHPKTYFCKEELAHADIQVRGH